MLSPNTKGRSDIHPPIHPMSDGVLDITGLYEFSGQGVQRSH